MQYRKEIDGLRALAVLPVILFHAGIKYFNGGFIGVDVFFVISGYLITTIILSEKQRGEFSFIAFYERRARRILPALFFVMLCCLPFAWMWLMPSDMKDFSKSLIYISYFQSNRLFGKEGGYFDTETELKPLMHTWSLGIEEQYYIIFPLIFLYVLRFKKAFIFAFLAVLLTSSLLFNYVQTLNYSNSFYMFFARIWEILIGALVAANLFYYPKSTNLATKNLLSLTGLCLIIYSILTFNEEIGYPGLYALIPTIGACLIILFADEKTWVGKVLSLKPLTIIGLISYSLYLWHQPIFSFARHYSFDNVNQKTFLALILLSIALAYATWFFIETPFRNKQKFTRKKIFIFSFLGILFFVGVGQIGERFDGFKERYSLPENISIEINNKRNSCRESFAGVVNDPKNKTHMCILGAPNNERPLISLFGDSHAGAISPAFDELGKKHGVGIAQITHPGCPPLLDVYVTHRKPFDACKKIAESQLNYAKKNGIKKVFLVSRWTLYTDGKYDGQGIRYLSLEDQRHSNKTTSRQAFEEGLKKTIAAYRSNNIDVYLIEQVPEQKNKVDEIYYRINSNLFPQFKDDLSEKYAVSTHDHLSLQSYTRNIFDFISKEGQITKINLDSVFCNGALCKFGTTDQPYYSDFTHISPYGAKLLSSELEKYIP